MVRFNCWRRVVVVGCRLHVHAHGHADASHAAAVQEWPLIGWKNARSRVCRRRVCEVMVSASFYGLPRARTYTRTVRPPLRAPCKTRAHILACYFASADLLDRSSWKQQITTRVQLDKRNRFSIAGNYSNRSRDFVL